MAAPEAPLPHLHSTQPIGRDAARITETTYAFPDGGADTLSPTEYDDYAVERMYGKDDPVAKQYKRVGRETVRQWRREGWAISPRMALIGTVLLTAAANLSLLDGVRIDGTPIGRIIPDAAGELIGEAGHLADGAGDFLDTGDQSDTSGVLVNNLPSGTMGSGLAGRRIFRLRLPGEEQRSGIAQPDAITVEEMVAEIEADKEAGRQADSVVVQGEASDEWLLKGESSLGVPDAENRRLAAGRAGVVANAARRLLRRDGIKGVAIKTEATEAVLGEAGLGDLLLSVNEYGYGSITSAVEAYNNGAKMPRGLKRLIKRELGQNRTDIATVEFSSRPVLPKLHPKHPKKEAKLTNHSDKHKSPFKLPFEFIPLVPVPWFRRRVKHLFNAVPQVAAKVPAKIWIELFKEAMPKRNNELVDDAWALTRKYQLLLRDGRIQQVTRFDYKDAQGEDQSFRVGFVDHIPAPETLAAVEDIMKKVSFMRDGRVAERLNAVMIFPSGNTGPQHPKKIGLGIDEQYARTTLGVAIPTIGLVELHMPVNPKREQLRGYNSMSWTLAHEVAGHFTDVLDEPPKLRRTSRGEPHRKNFEASGSWAGVGDDGYARVGQRDTVSVSGRQFAVPASQRTRLSSGPDEFLVTADDPRLRDASFIQLLRLQRMGPTVYADESAMETYAETAANATTGSPIPYSQAGVEIPNAAVRGYHADAGLLFDFATRIGSLRNADKLTWAQEAVARIEASWQRHDIDINQDPELNRASEFAKNNPHQPPKDRLRILAGATD
jgi:hypothetical protein